MGPPPTLPLVAAIRRGDEAAFTQFYDDWFDRCMATTRQLTRRDESFCLDVVQDVMMKVIQRLPPLTTDAAVDSWMVRTLFTTAMDRLRADGRRRDRERTVAETRPEHTVADGPDREHVDWLTAKLAELPPADRNMLLARYRDSATLREVGHSLGLTAFAVHGRIRRILDRWRRLPMST